MIKVADAETGDDKWIDTSSILTREVYSRWWLDHMSEIQNMFKKCGVDSAYISTSEDYVKPLIKLFESR
ncbi:MAG TPA: hypothetical protein ENO27_04115 [Caldithrix sp.]|nr:hypothetical protein [Caldithrix sp.]